MTANEATIAPVPMTDAELELCVGGDNPGMGPYTPGFSAGIAMDRESDKVEDMRGKSTCRCMEHGSEECRVRRVSGWR